MITTVAQAQPTITSAPLTSVPLDPQAMTALIQQINDMYSNTFTHYLALFGIAAGLLGVLVAIILAVQNWMSKKNISDTTQSVEQLKKELALLKEQAHELHQLKEDSNHLKEDFHAFKIRFIEQRIIDEKKILFQKNRDTVEQIKEEHARNYPADAIFFCTSAIVDNIKQISDEQLNTMEQLPELNNSANELLAMQITILFMRIAQYIPAAKARPDSEVSLYGIGMNWQEDIEIAIESTKAITKLDPSIRTEIDRVITLLQTDLQTELQQEIQGETQNEAQCNNNHARQVDFIDQTAPLNLSAPKPSTLKPKKSTTATATPTAATVDAPAATTAATTNTRAKTTKPKKTASKKKTIANNP